MSYIVFLILFICLPLAGMVRLLRGKIRPVYLTMLGVIALIALVYTTPWDNYLVAKRVWYYDPALILKITIGYVPLEEYAFFILQTFLTGLFAFWLWRRFYAQDFDRAPDPHITPTNLSVSKKKKTSAKLK